MKKEQTIREKPSTLNKADLKAELSNYPTKSHLRAELKQFATKDDLSKLETKLDNFVDMAVETFATKTELREVKEDVKYIRGAVDSILTAIDGIVKTQAIHESEQAAMSQQVDRHETWIKKAAPKVGVALEY